jgi:hypothetical protein
MSVLVLPPFDEEPWPSLGGPICDLIEERAVFGPGSLKGQPAVLDDEKRAAIWKAYEVYPRGHELAGRRRFKRVRLSWRKGTAKTEFAAWIAFAELHPDGPVRFDGWDANGNPVGRPVRDPYIPMLAYTQEQVEELAYGALVVVCSEGADADLFDIGLDRIIRLDEYGRADGKSVPLAGAPDSRDGSRVTFQHYDETHRLHSDRHRAAYETMEANLPKRPLDDPWSLGTTTAGRPGQDSVAELDKQEAEDILKGKITEPQLFYFHRQASDETATKAIKSGKIEDRIKAIEEATGPVGEYAPGQFRDIALQWDRPKADTAYLERTWWNRWRQAANQCFDAAKWTDGKRPDYMPAPRSLITLGFDGARYRDMAALIATELHSGFQWPIGAWSHEDFDEGLGIPSDEVDAAFDAAIARYRVLRVYGDPAMGWDSNLARWSGKLGPKKVAFFYTDSRNLRATAQMCSAYAGAIKGGEVTNNGNDIFAEHVANAHKRDIHMVDDDGTPLWVMAKERPDSRDKIDLAMAGGLSWQARLDAIKGGDADKGGLTRVTGRVRSY